MKEHKILDHPIVGYFLLLIFANLVSVIVSGIIDSMILGNIIPGYAVTAEIQGRTVVSASGVGNAVGAIIAVGIFFLWFRPQFDGMLKKKDILKALLLLLPICAVHWIGSIASCVQFGVAAVPIAFLRSAAPGFGEETAFRGLGVANYMRKDPSEKGILTAFWLSSIVFGLIHIGNALNGAPLGISVLQGLYAIGIGMALGAVYLRTGNILPCMFAHMSLDFLEFCRGDLGSTGGIMINLGIGDWITIVAGIAGAVWGLYLIRPAVRADITALWKDKWSSTAAPADAS